MLLVNALEGVESFLEVRDEREDFLLRFIVYKLSKEIFATQAVGTRRYSKDNDGIVEGQEKAVGLTREQEEPATEDQ